MRQWNLKLSSETEADYNVYLEFSPATTPQVTVTVSGSHKSVVTRFLGYMIVSILPENSLPEALQSLKEVWDFYTEEPSYSSTHRLLPRKIEATVARKEKRPGLVLSK